MRLIDDITKFIFIEDEPEVSDIIFIPGSSRYELSEKASELYNKGLSKIVLPSGKFPSNLEGFPNDKVKSEIYTGNYESECEFSKEILVRNRVPLMSILYEDKSTNTYENAFFSKTVTDELGMNIKKAIICCKPFHARRVLMTYSWAYPNTNFYIVPANTGGVCAENWYKSSHGINIVLGELKRCGSYFGDYFNKLSEIL